VKPLTLKPHEARQLEKGSVLIVRPVEPQPPFHGHKEVWCHELDRYETDWGFFDEDREYVCPLGKPGIETWGRETHWRRGHSSGWCGADPIEPEWTTHKPIPEDNGLSRSMLIRYEDPGDPAHWQPRSPATMPKWASRFPRLVIATVRACRLSGLTRDEAASTGLRITVNAKEYMPGQGGFFAQWTRDYPKFPAASDPWVWMARVERRNADE
jgi:hypothetical protein